MSLLEAIAKIENIENSKKHLRSSEFYGIDEIIKSYLGLPKWFPLQYLSYIEHGVLLSNDTVPERLQKSKAEFILLNNSLRLNTLNKVIAQKFLYVVGSPFVHYRRMHQINTRPDAQGTLVFPTHSSHYSTVKTDWVKYAQKLANLPAFLQPVTACLYWKDIMNGNHKPFLDAGIPVVTNGHLYDKQHIPNLYDNLSRHKYVTGNDIGSFLFYAVEMGLPFFLFGDEVDYESDERFKREASQEGKMIEEVLNKLFRPSSISPESILITPAQKEWVDKFIDEKNWANPAVLRRRLWKNLLPTILEKGFLSLI